VRGLSCFNPASGAAKNYTVEHGLQSNEFNVGAYYRNPLTGEMFFGGIAGFNAFYPENIKDNPYSPPVSLTSLRVLNRSVNFDTAISKIEEVDLHHRDSFTVSFAALCYSAPHRNQYRYRIDGLHDKWVSLGNQHTLTFANLEPGEYTLRIKGANSDGVWNNQETALKINIPPPFWKTVWFRLLIIISLGVLALIWHGRRLKLKQMLLDIETDMEQFYEKYDVSTREREIVNLILKGKNNREIEEKLFISIGTVKNHIYSIYRKVGVKTRGQLILKITTFAKN
jgi:DNA-binding CsgD family transcriptional regulator